MSVIVKGMEMPKSCASCRMAVCFADTGRAKCYATLSYIDPKRGKRSYYCPLRSLPEKHGNLIDETPLMKYFLANKYEKLVGGYVAMMLMATPTIVEAEAEGE